PMMFSRRYMTRKRHAHFLAIMVAGKFLQQVQLQIKLANVEVIFKTRQPRHAPFAQLIGVDQFVISLGTGAEGDARIRQQVFAEHKVVHIPAAEENLIVAWSQQQAQLMAVVFQQDVAQIKVLQEETLAVVAELGNDVEWNVVVVDDWICPDTDPQRNRKLPFPNLYAAACAAFTFSGGTQQAAAAQDKQQASNKVSVHNIRCISCRVKSPNLCIP